MKRVGVLYATREGHTARIAAFIEQTLRSFGIDAEVTKLQKAGTTIQVESYDALILASSVHIGTHEPELVNFVKAHRVQLETIPSAFVSVTLSQAGVEMPGTTQAQTAQAATGVQEILDRFYADTGWRPKYVKPVAGALLYRKYNFLKRFILRRISKKAGGSTDTSRNHVYTDWTGLEDFVTELVVRFGLAERTPASCAG